MAAPVAAPVEAVEAALDLDHAAVPVIRRDVVASHHQVETETVARTAIEIGIVSATEIVVIVGVIGAIVTQNVAEMMTKAATESDDEASKVSVQEATRRDLLVVSWP
ncbi:hypothetical protein PINS_up016078 [Pythium insidiosum]|nr:hypothetical protein PINS_up016078 [Pythium insidiosum]